MEFWSSSPGVTAVDASAILADAAKFLTEQDAPLIHPHGADAGVYCGTYMRVCYDNEPNVTYDDIFGAVKSALETAGIPHVAFRNRGLFECQSDCLGEKSTLDAELFNSRGVVPPPPVYATCDVTVSTLMNRKYLVLLMVANKDSLDAPWFSMFDTINSQPSLAGRRTIPIVDPNLDLAFPFGKPDPNKKRTLFL
jgi:hypothetical protein